MKKEATSEAKVSRQNQYTPGPWEYCPKLSGSENHRGFAVKKGDTFVAFDVSPRDSEGKEGEANARLIAAAPELLEACKFAYDIGLHGGDSWAWPEKLRKAIAKAEGAA